MWLCYSEDDADEVARGVMAVTSFPITRCLGSSTTFSYSLPNILWFGTWHASVWWNIFVQRPVRNCVRMLSLFR